MTDEKDTPLREPDIFSRGSIQLTFDLIRKEQPSLAMSLQNILNSEPLPKLPGQPDNKHSDHFKVSLEPRQVRSIVECITKVVEAPLTDKNAGMLVVGKTLLNDWWDLAHMMLENKE